MRIMLPVMAAAQALCIGAYRPWLKRFCRNEIVGKRLRRPEDGLLGLAETEERQSARCTVENPLQPIKSKAAAWKAASGEIPTRAQARPPVPCIDIHRYSWAAGPSRTGVSSPRNRES